MKGIRTDNPLAILAKGVQVDVPPGEYVVHDGRYAWGKVQVAGDTITDVAKFKSLDLVYKEGDQASLIAQAQELLGALQAAPQPDSAAGKFLFTRVPELLQDFLNEFGDGAKATKMDNATTETVLEDIAGMADGLQAFGGALDDVAKANLVENLYIHLTALERWLAANDDTKSQPPPDDMAMKTRKCNIVGKDAKRQIVTGVVLEPNTEDAQGEMETPDQIENAFLQWSEYFGAIGIGHQDLANERTVVVEKWIARADLELPDGPVKKGSWMLSVRVKDPDLWAAIEAGEITGFSIGGTAQVQE